MSQIIQLSAVSVGVASYFVAAPTIKRFLEFFTAQIRSANTRRFYAKAAVEFLAWCEVRGARSLDAITPIYVAGRIEEMTCAHSAPTVKQRLAVARHLFDWLVTGHVIKANRAHSVRGPKHFRRRGKTPVLSPEPSMERSVREDLSHLKRAIAAADNLTASCEPMRP